MVNKLTFKNLLNPARKMTITYVISLTVIAVLCIIVHVNIDKIIIEQSQSASTINVSGQQRMLSQRIALFTAEFIAQNNKDARQKALSALEKMILNHQYLLVDHNTKIKQRLPTSLTPEMEALYFSAPHEVDQKVAEFTNLIKRALSYDIISLENSQQRLMFLPLAKNQLLNSFETVVKQYELESQQKIQTLRSTQQIILIVIILTILIEAVFILGPLLNRSDQYTKTLEDDANHDYLTNCLNRRSFNVLAKQQIAMSKRYKTAISFISIDIDHFKSINDQYGHTLGDEVIKKVADVIHENSRESDSVFRFGGEEFLVMLPTTSIAEGFQLAEKMLYKIANTPVFSEKLIIEFTVSAGVAEWHSSEDNIEKALQRADVALYQAKEGGRDQIVKQELVR
jgi:diguanylate cyclase (GGDEF)-like protein